MGQILDNHLLMINPFFSAYLNSDLFGKAIFISLFILSVFSWIVLIHKAWILHQVRRQGTKFKKIFEGERARPLNLDLEKHSSQHNPFYEIYMVLKKQTVDLLNKNHQFGKGRQGGTFLSSADVEFVESHLVGAIAHAVKLLEKNLFILSTSVSLSPFLGLLGTVWGILITFSQMQVAAVSGGNQVILGGISLALATTVLGLMNAIPALLGYNYLRDGIRGMALEMETFAQESLACVEMQYRRVDSS